MRYLPLTEADRRSMLATIGVPSVDSLFRDVPEAARLSAPIEGQADDAGEMEVERTIAAMAAKNISAGSVPGFLGSGPYRHHVPASGEHLIQRREFQTSYAPDPPADTQGTL